VARIVLPLTFLVALSHLLYGGGAPGDGFTAGALLGLVTALWYVIFGHAETRERLPMLKPYHLLRAGLGLEMLNALLPMLLSGNFMKYVDYGKLLHIDEFLLQFGLHLSSTLLFEIGVCLTVFGVITTIMEIIAHPASAADMGAD
jgi:multisubunit Na+/H+ antiporter MnhB subunit